MICSRCVMDETAGDIEFFENGTCNYCCEMHEQQDARFDNVCANGIQFVKKVKSEGQNKKFDCIIGLSGGVDSAWALHLAVKHGLRPLAVHMDNGWNSELAQHNISSMTNTLGVPFESYVIDWREYKSLMQSFFDADVVDIELLYDNAMLGVLYKCARKYGVRYILSGSNSASEGMRMPPSWNWYKYDKKNIKSIQKKFQGTTIKSFPAYGTLQYLTDRFAFQIKWIPFLDFFEYDKNVAFEELEKLYGFYRYPYKHYESIFTRFYQAYILPKKFGIDKRKLHLSTLIVSGQITRVDAIKLLQQSPYPSSDMLDLDRKYFLKKMDWSEENLLAYLSRPSIAHDVYGSEHTLPRRLSVISKNFLFKAFFNALKKRGSIEI